MIGKVGRPHGIDGAFFVEQPSDDRRWWTTGARFLARGVPVEVVAHRTSSGRPVIRVEPPVERGSLLEVEREQLPPTEPDEWYAFELVGLPVMEEGGRLVGTVKAVEPGVANDVLELDSGALLPMVEDCILRVDLDAPVIEVAKGFAD
ncbi:MAG TPA: ribosome maturation factor RimM [Gaiellaceae bacterium]|nr:ribosome maturation factor RimM [Gaiellaceae bacterium]